jgi:thiol-disulfide isomerase/thioredoxin
MIKLPSLFLIILFSILNLHAIEVPKCVLSGEIKNPVSDSLFIENDNGELVRAIRLNKKKTFSVELQVIEGYYTIGDENEHTQLFLSPGFDLTIFINTKAFDESIFYKGKGAAENNFLAKFYLLNERLENLKYYGYYAKLNETAFLNLMDSIRLLEMNLLNTNKELLLSRFYDLEAMKINYDYRMKLNEYESMHRYLTGNNDFMVSPLFPDPFVGVDLNNPDWFNIYEYTGLIEAYIWRLANNDYKEKLDTNYHLLFYKNLESKIVSPVLKEQFAYKIGKYSLMNVLNMEAVYQKTILLIQSPEKKNEVITIYNKIKLLQAGNPSPDFKFKDLTGNDFQLSDFKGKYVYIDVWATWCGPCLSEIPALKKLTDTLASKDIVFVSICVFDDKSSWEKMVTQKQLKGIQLFAESSKNSFVDEYMIQGIPRFILLDKSGRIINANAQRPSEPMLMKELTDWLD